MKLTSHPLKSLPCVVFALAVSAGAACSKPAPSPAGRWDAVATVRGFEVPFTFEIAQQGSTLSGSFFDGEVKVPSTSGAFVDGKVSLTFAQYGSRIDATLTDNRLEGRYDRGTRGAAYGFRATREQPPSAVTGPVPSISGEWRIVIPNKSSNGESSWRFLITQNGPGRRGRDHACGRRQWHAHRPVCQRAVAAQSFLRRATDAHRSDAAG